MSFLMTANYYSQFISIKNGDWRDPLTWSSDPNSTAIPDSNSSVTVNHYVVVSSSPYQSCECKNLTISETGVIDNYTSSWVSGDLNVKNNLINNGTISPAYDFWLYVGGDFFNNGIITKHYISNKQYLYLMGNLYNNGSFRFSNTTISKYLYQNSSTPHEHTIKSLNDSTIYLGEVSVQDSMGIITIDSLAILSGTINLNGSKILLTTKNTYSNDLIFDKLTIYGGSIEANKNTLSTKPGTWGYLHYIYNIVKPTKIFNANFNGDFLIGGDGPNTSGGSNLYFIGETKFDGKMADWYSSNIWSMGDRMVILEGTFENFGQVYNATTGTGKGLFLKQNHNSLFVNKGRLENKGIYFSGSSTLIPNDTLFVDEFNATDSTTIANISGDLIFGNSAGTLINFNRGKLRLSENSKFFNPISPLNNIINTRIEGNNSSIYCTIGRESNTELSNLKIDFLLYLGYNGYKHKMSESIEVNHGGTFAPYYNYYPEVEINGDLTNYGHIKNNSIGELKLYISGNILHDGNEWTNAETKLNGVIDQSIVLPNDLPITGKIIFDAMIQGSVYQWQLNGSDIPNAIAKDLVFQNGITKADYGNYVCIVDGVPSRTIIVGNKRADVLEIYDVKIDVLNSNQAKISWKTTIPANGFVFYAENDTTAGFPFEAMESEELVVNHEIILNSLNSGSTYYFIIDQMDKDWNNVRSKTFSFVAGAVSVEEENIPLEFSLSQNYPNPFNPSTIIKYAIPTSGFVSLKIFNILGKEVATLVNQQMNAGNYKVEFDAANLSSGIYFYILQSGSFSKTNKMLLIK